MLQRRHCSDGIADVDFGLVLLQLYQVVRAVRILEFTMCVYGVMVCAVSKNRGCHGHVRTVLLAIIFDQYQKNTTMSSATMLHSHKRYLLMPIVRAGVGLNILNPPHPISLQPFDVAIISRFANSGQFDNTFLSFADARSPVLCGAGAS